MRGSRCHEAYPLPGERDLDSGALSPREHSCANYGMRFAPEAGLMRASWDSLFGNLFRACPSPFGRGWREAPGEGRKCTLIRPFGPPSPRGRRTRTSISANLDTTALPLGEAPRGRETCKLQEHSGECCRTGDARSGSPSCANRELAAYFKGRRTEREACAPLKIIN